MRRDDLPRVGDLIAMNQMFPLSMLEPMALPYLAGETHAHRWIVFDVNGVDGVAYYAPEPMTEGTWNMLMICVDLCRHGRGIGTRLMCHAEEELQKEPARILLVETSGLPEFGRTREFYAMLGYDREAQIREYYAAGEDKVIFRKALA